jgi:hypothetical protein
MENKGSLCASAIINDINNEPMIVLRVTYEGSAKMEYLCVSVQCSSLSVMASLRASFMDRILLLYRSILASPPSLTISSSSSSSSLSTIDNGSISSSSSIIPMNGAWPASASSLILRGVAAILEHSSSLMTSSQWCEHGQRNWQAHIIDHVLPLAITRLQSCIPLITLLHQHCQHQRHRHQQSSSSSSSLSSASSTSSTSSLPPLPLPSVPLLLQPPPNNDADDISIGDARHQWLLAKQIYTLLRTPMHHTTATTTTTSTEASTAASSSIDATLAAWQNELDLFLF